MQQSDLEQVEPAGKRKPRQEHPSITILKMTGVVAAIAVCISAAVCVLSVGYLWFFTPDRGLSSIGVPSANNPIPTVETSALIATATTFAHHPVSLRYNFETEASDWPTREFSDAEASGFQTITNGKYHIELTSSQEHSESYTPKMRFATDFTVAVDIQHFQGDRDTTYGLILRALPNSYYFFGIDDTKHFTFQLLYMERWLPLIDWQKSPAILPGEINHLSAVVYRDQFTLFINGQYVGQAQDDHIKSGAAGILVMQYGKDRSVFEADNFELRAPSQTPNPTLAITLAVPPVKGPQKIVFSAPNREGQSLEIYTANPDGGDLEQLTVNTFRDAEPTWSPDRQKIVFVSDRDGNPELYSMDVDGSNVRRLTNDPAEDVQPAWSPDRTMIAFVSNRAGNPEIYLLNLKDQGLTRLTDSAASEQHPSWSPDGKQIVFQSDKNGDSDLYLMDNNGSRVRQFTYYSRYDGEPVWSPDGKSIAYVAERTGKSEIFIRDLTGKVFIQATRDEYENRSPVWSPDGRTLAYVSLREGAPMIYLLDVEEMISTPLSSLPAGSDAPDW